MSRLLTFRVFISRRLSGRLFDEADHVELYQKFRPKWTPEFAVKVVTFLKKKKTSPLFHAVDVGCGSGQSTAILAPHLQQVLGIDASEAQISKASAANKLNSTSVEYRVGQAEAIPVPDGSVDLVTCVSSAHWFDLEKFHAEVDRVLVPGGCLAVAGYVDNTFTDDTLTRIAKQHIFQGPMGNCFNERSQYYLNSYKDLPMPYDETVRDESLCFEADLTLPEYIGLVSTYTPYREFCRRYPGDKGAFLQNLLRRLYEATKSTKPPEEVTLHQVYPVFLVMSRKPQ